MDTEDAPVSCGPRVKSPPASGARAIKRRLDISFPNLDLSGCERRQDTDSTLEEAIDVVNQVLGATGVDVSLNKIHVPSEKQAVSLGFLVSPTIRVNGRDIQMKNRENRCESCGTPCECKGGVICREWDNQGQWYTAPSKGLLIEAILKEVCGGPVEGREESRNAEQAPGNPKRFLYGLPKQDAADRS